MRCVLDTNVLVSAVIPRPSAGSGTAIALFEQARRGRVVLLLHSAVIAEAMIVMTRHYRMSRETASSIMRSIIEQEGVQVDCPEWIGEALNRFETTTLDFIDCFVAAISALDQTPLATFDRQLSRQPGVIPMDLPR
ncbi:MAG: type II toxin-antitoxin system VapC family toxin [Methylacidiphilales bacterium]|nr:type II toxin-antitoxin system VapC family toxin [Candidatus Methylacidiphilales bacterium]